MAQQGYEYISDFARQFVAEGVEKGQKETLVKLLGLKFGEVPAEVRERIQAASSEQVDIWTARVLKAQTLEQVFADS